MEKPLYELKRLGLKLRSLLQKSAKEHGIDMLGGPQGQVLHFIGCREEAGQVTLIKDIEQKMGVAKSVASNLVKRMEGNGLIYLESSRTDKRAKYVRLTEQAKAQMEQVRNFFDEMDRNLLAGISPEDLAIFQAVLQQFIDNLEKIGEKDG